MRLSKSKFIRFSLLVEAITRNTLATIKSKFKVPNPNPLVDSHYSQNIPKTEEELSELLKQFENLSPDNSNPEYILFLAQTAFSDHPSWDVAIDGYGVSSELKEYDALLKSKKLRAPENQITYFTTRQSLISFIHTKKEFISTNHSGVEEHDKLGLNKSLLIDTIGAWSVIKVPRGSDAETLHSAYLLCSNKRHGSSWCVGYEDGRSKASSYLPDGDFYVFQKNNVSIYAVSTKTSDNSLIIWNRADSRLVDTSNLGEGSSPSYLNRLMPHLQKTVLSLGGNATDFFSNLSHVPEEIRPVLIKLKSNPQAEVFKTIPNNLLSEIPTEKQAFIFRVLHNTNKASLIDDFNSSFDDHSISQNDSAILTLYALFTYIAMPHKGISFTADQLYNFNWTPFMAYVEAHANSHDRNMSKEIHEVLLRVIS